MMQLGYLSAILPEASLADVLTTAEVLGYDCVELACWPVGDGGRRYAGVTHLDLNTDVAFAEGRQQLADSPVAVSALGYYPNALDADDRVASAAQQHLRVVIERAAELEVGTVTTFIGRDHTRSVEENWPRFVEVWTPLIEHAESHGVRVAIENCPMIFTADEWPGGKNLAFSPAIWRRMFEAVPSPSFGLNYDPSHLVWMQMDPVAPIRDFGDRIFHVHAKDVRVDRQKLDDLGTLAHPNDYHAPKLPGLGDLDWAAFFAALGDVRYRGPVVAEVEDRSYEGSEQDRRLALRQCHDFLRNYVPRRLP